MAGFARAQEKAPGKVAQVAHTAGRLPATSFRGMTARTTLSSLVRPFDFGRIAIHSAQPWRSSRDPESPRSSQASRADQASAIHAGTQRDEQGTAPSLPHLHEIQRSFGSHDVSRVRSHQGSDTAAMARALGARAYTAGEHVSFTAPPDLRTAAHEAAHAVQQRTGVRLDGNMSRPGDQYERHADAVAEMVVQRRSAESLLNRLRPASSPAVARPPVIQCAAIATDFGTFDTTKYDNLGPSGSEYGVDIELAFDPDSKKVDAKKIGLTQTVHNQLGGKDVPLFPVEKERMVASGTGAGSQIDRYGGGGHRNPLYGRNQAAAGDKLGDTAAMASHAQVGFNYMDGSTQKHQKAISKDQPTLPGRGNNSGQSFESAALAVEGVQSGTYMGSVSWGWNVDGAGKFTKQPLALKEKGNPSSEFKAAATQWNKTSAGGTIKTIPDPTNVFDNSYAVAFTVAKDTEVEVSKAAPIHNDETYDETKIKTGPKANSTGRIKVNDLKESGGTNVIKLPTP